MNELLNVNADSQTVSARELHKVLGVSHRFNDWINTNKNLFVENEDYTCVPVLVEVQNNGGVQKRELNDYVLTIDMAKHLCMMSRTEKGKQCRQYLIDLEKAWNTPEQVMARALRVADATIDKLSSRNRELIEHNEQLKPKAIFADAVATSKTSILVGDLAKLICQNGIEIGQKRLFQWLRERGYLIKNGDSRNMPVQRYVEQGLFEIKESNVQNADGSVRITKTTKVTGKGQVYFLNKFLTE